VQRPAHRLSHAAAASALAGATLQSRTIPANIKLFAQGVDRAAAATIFALARVKRLLAESITHYLSIEIETFNLLPQHGGQNVCREFTADVTTQNT
jgi:hypothetical protein